MTQPALTRAHLANLITCRDPFQRKEHTPLRDVAMAVGALALGGLGGPGWAWRADVDRALFSLAYTFRTI